MPHAARAFDRLLPLASCVLALGLAGCAPEADPGPTTDPTATTTTTTTTTTTDPTDPPAHDPPTFLAPGQLTVRWTFGDAELTAACASHRVTSARLEVGLDAPVVVDCAVGEQRYAELPAGMYSVGVVLIDAKGAEVDARYEAVLIPSGAAAEVRTTF